MILLGEMVFGSEISGKSISHNHSRPACFCQRAACFAATVLAHEGGRFARPRRRSAYAYTPSCCGPARLASPLRVPLRLRRRNKPRMASLVEFGVSPGAVVPHPLERRALPPPLLAAHPAMLRRRNTVSSPRGRSAANATNRSRRSPSTGLRRPRGRLHLPQGAFLFAPFAATPPRRLGVGSPD